MELKQFMEHARSLEIACKLAHTKSCNKGVSAFISRSDEAHPESSENNAPEHCKTAVQLSAVSTPSVFLCGFPKHPRVKCPARDFICNKCSEKRH